jgi:hypothetical protein
MCWFSNDLLIQSPLMLFSESLKETKNSLETNQPRYEIVKTVESKSKLNKSKL